MTVNKVELCGVNTAKLPLLKEEEKEELFERIKAGDEEAREKYIKGNLRLVLSVIKRFENSSENADDLFQIGCVGLMKAVDHFDPGRMVKFSTYAVPMIIGEIRRYLRDNSPIRVSRSLRDTAYKAIYAKEGYIKRHMKEPTVQEIAEEIKDSILSRKQHDHYRNQLELEIQETRDKMKKRFLTSMLFGEQESRKIADCNSINQEYSTSFKEGVFQAVFIKVDTDGGEEESIGSMIEKLEKYTDILGDVCEEHITTEMHSGIITLVNYKFEQEALVRKKIEEMYEEIKKYIDRFEGFSVVLGVGRKMDHFLESNLCLQTAIDAIKYRIRISNTNIIYLENYQFEPYDINKIVTEGKKQAYLSKVVSGDIRGAQECLAATLREIRYSGGSYSPILFFDILIAYVDLLTDYCKQQDLYSEEYERNLKKWNVSTDNIRSEKMLLAVTEDLIRETLEYAAEEKKSKDIKPIREIKKYIEEIIWRRSALASWRNWWI